MTNDGAMAIELQRLRGVTRDQAAEIKRLRDIESAHVVLVRAGGSARHALDMARAATLGLDTLAVAELGDAIEEAMAALASVLATIERKMTPEDETTAAARFSTVDPEIHGGNTIRASRDPGPLGSTSTNLHR